MGYHHDPGQNLGNALVAAEARDPVEGLGRLFEAHIISPPIRPRRD